MPTLAATSQRHHGPAGEQLLARLRANTATAGAPEMSAVPRIQKRGEAAARALASERTGALEHRGLQVCVIEVFIRNLLSATFHLSPTRLQVRERAIKEYIAKDCTVTEIARRAGITGAHSLSSALPRSHLPYSLLL